MEWKEIDSKIPIGIPVQVNYGKNGAVGEFSRYLYTKYFISIGTHHIIYLPDDSWERAGITHYRIIDMSDFPTPPQEDDNDH